MGTKVEIIEKEIGHVVEIEENVKMMKMPKVMGINFNRIMDYINKNGAECTGAPYARYLDIDWDVQMEKSGFANFIEVFTKNWHFMTGAATSQALPAEKEITPRVFEKKKYVTAIHKGPYQKVGKTYKNIYKFVKEKGLEMENNSIEIYTNDPGECKKEDIETIVLIPLKE